MNNPHVIVIDPEEYPQKAFIVDEKHVEPGLISGDVVMIKNNVYCAIEDVDDLKNKAGVFAGRLSIEKEKDRIIT